MILPLPMVPPQNHPKLKFLRTDSRRYVCVIVVAQGRKSTHGRARCLGQNPVLKNFDIRSHEIPKVKKTWKICVTFLRLYSCEIEMLQQCNHPNVVRYLGNYQGEEYLWIVMEYCGGGSVANVMNVTDEALEEYQIEYICTEALKGLSYLHSIFKVHRDIKGGNILLTEQGESEELGRYFRNTMYPGEDTGLLRLHSTYRHDLKIYSSDEGRVQGLLDLEGQLTPTLVSLVSKGSLMLDGLDNASIEMEEAKARLNELITTGVKAAQANELSNKKPWMVDGAGLPLNAADLLPTLVKDLFNRSASKLYNECGSSQPASDALAKDTICRGRRRFREKDSRANDVPSLFDLAFLSDQILHLTLKWS
ncbi:unnamed protein product [Lactuca saligna]|uniref:Protein kinase domain-containing protein n=1 Tax=Lactuca saligna TaxID=75948 RepID=A0AA35YNW2_LACSI|nr:unnamed protein product [Lactuca saligna]